MNIDIWIDDFVYLFGSDGNYTLQFYHIGKDKKTGKVKRTLKEVLHPGTLLHALQLYCRHASSSTDNKKATDMKTIIDMINVQNIKLENFCRNFYKECQFQGKKSFTLKDEFKADKFIIVGRS